MNQHHESAERLTSYAIGTGGIAIGGISWSGIVSLAGDLTTIIGFFTAVMGLGLVIFRLWRDIRGVAK